MEASTLTPETVSVPANVRMPASHSVRLMEYKNKFSYTKHANMVNTILELKMWVKPATTFNNCPPMHEKGWTETTPGGDS